MPITKEQKKENNKKYRENNKAKIAELNKKYREKNKEKIAKQKKEWNEKNKDKIKERRKEYKKEYYENNKDKILEHNKEYYENNKDKILEHKKEYNQTEARKKSNRILNWINSGVICDDFNSLYDKYINTKYCEECNIELVEGNYGSNKKCLDHDHETGLFRNVLCCSCNVKRG